MSRPVRLAATVGACAVCSLATVVALAPAASAHVTVQPPTANAGGYATLSFKVPNERDNASTTGLTVQLPTDAPIPSVSVQPKPGWTHEVTRGEPATPVTAHGTPVTEVVTEISWTPNPGNDGIRPGEFDMFTISAGALPEEADQLVFKAIQTYSNGEQVRWIEVAEDGQAEPELPAPVLTLTTADGEESHDTPVEASGTDAESGTAAPVRASSSDDTARGLGFAGLVAGAAGFAIGGFALASARRRPSA